MPGTGRGTLVSLQRSQGSLLKCCWFRPTLDKRFIFLRFSHLLQLRQNLTFCGPLCPPLFQFLCSAVHPLVFFLPARHMVFLARAWHSRSVVNVFPGSLSEVFWFRPTLDEWVISCDLVTCSLLAETWHPAVTVGSVVVFHALFHFETRTFTFLFLSARQGTGLSSAGQGVALSVSRQLSEGSLSEGFWFRPTL